MINIRVTKILSLFLIFMCINASALTIKMAVVSNTENALNFTDGKFSGELASKYQCVIDALPYSIEFYVLPYARLLKMLKAGSIDVGLPLSKSETRSEFAQFTLPLTSITIDLYSQKPLNDKTKYNQLTVVFSRSSAVKPIADKYNMTSYEVNGWQQAIKMVAHGRHDAAFIPTIIADGFDKKIFQGLYRQSSGVLQTSMYVSKKSQYKDELVEKINIETKNCLAALVLSKKLNK